MSKKYKFSSKFKDSRVMIKGVGVVTSDTVTDAQAKRILKDGNHPNLIVEVTEPKGKAVKKA